jgi:hypothetical protein
MMIDSDEMPDMMRGRRTMRTLRTLPAGMRGDTGHLMAGETLDPEAAPVETDQQKAALEDLSGSDVEEQQPNGGEKKCPPAPRR